MAYCGWVRQDELSVRPGRILEAEEPVHPPTAIRLPEQQGDVSTVLGHADAARIAPGLFEGAELRRVIRRDASRRDGETEVHVLERRPVAPRHRRQPGGAPHRVERRPLEHRRVGVQRGIRLGVVSPVGADYRRIQRVDAGRRLAGGGPNGRPTGEAYDAKGNDSSPGACALRSYHEISISVPALSLPGGAMRRWLLGLAVVAGCSSNSTGP